MYLVTIFFFTRITDFAKIPQYTVSFYLPSPSFATPELHFIKIWHTACLNFMQIVLFVIKKYSHRKRQFDYHENNALFNTSFEFFPSGDPVV